MTSSKPPICDYEGADYQTRFWEQGGRIYEDRAEAIALKRLLPNSGELLLELGAGAGRNTGRYTGFKQVVLLDYSITQLKQAVQRLGQSQRYIFVAADIYNLPFVDGLFDAATMIRTLHHMSEPQLALHQVRRTLQPGATFILEYANKRNIKAIFRYLFRKQSWSPFSKVSIEFEKLNFDFHPRAVSDWLKACDFSMQDRLAVSYLRIGLLKQYLPIDLLIRLEGWLQLTGRLFLLSPSVFTLNQAVGGASLAKEGAFFKCPVCKSEEFVPREGVLICNQCSREWLVQDGIYDFRL